MARHRMPAPDEPLEARVRRLEIRAAISELLVRYTHLIDDHEFDALGELFTDDAEFGVPGRVHRGRDAIVANYRDRGAMYPISLHEVRGLALDIADDTHATGQVTAFSEQASDRHTVRTSFRYSDRYECVDGAWLFASRITRALYALTHDEYARGGMGWELRKRWPHRDPERAELPPFLAAT